MSTRVDCRDCVNRINRPYPQNRDYFGRCRYDMRSASTAGGGEPLDLHEVYWCRDYEQETDEWED